jgi:ADP-ribosylation factor GTPase-activating protein 1
MENTKQDPKMPGFDDLQRDPVAALTKGFGWFTTTVGKTAKTVNEGYIQPTAAKVVLLFYIPSSFFLLRWLGCVLILGIQIAETDLARQAQLTAAQVARGAQTGAKSAADGFNRFVEGSDGSASRGAYRTTPIDESKKDFWDSFAEAGNSRPSAVGTSAIKKAGGGSGMGGAGGKKEDDNWDKW